MGVKEQGHRLTPEGKFLRVYRAGHSQQARQEHRMQVKKKHTGGNTVFSEMHALYARGKYNAVK